MFAGPTSVQWGFIRCLSEIILLNTEINDVTANIWIAELLYLESVSSDDKISNFLNKGIIESNKKNLFDSFNIKYFQGIDGHNFKELENNFVCWDNVFGNRINSEPEHIMGLETYSEHFRFFVAWLELRLDWLNECFNNEETWLGEINDRSYPLYKEGAIPQIEKDVS